MHVGPRSEASRDALVTEQVAEVAVTLYADVATLVGALYERLSTEIDDLRGDERLSELLWASIESNTENALHILQHGIDIDRLEVPPAAIEYARRLAQRGIPVQALVRAYRLGHGAFMKRGFEVLQRQAPEPWLAMATAERLTDLGFAMIDRQTEQVFSAYEDERERWLQQRNAEREARIRVLLRGDPVDVAAAEATLGYQLLGRRHLAIVVWTAQAGLTDASTADLERFLLDLAERLDCPARPLFLPHDQGSGWAWLPIGPDGPDWPQLWEATEASTGDIRVAAGEAGADVAGFRRSHDQALQAQSVALAAGADAAGVTRFAETGPIALMCADLPVTRAWVADTLGQLALDDEQHGRLRETLRVFLATGGSYSAAAQQLSMHRNSVHYRVRKAEEVLGGSIEDADRLDVEIALKTCHWLGRSVLTPVP